MMLNILFLVFGDKMINHIQANFSILTLLTQKEQIASINIVTDMPQLYHKLAASGYVKIVQINTIELNDWKGEYDFIWRVKIKAFELMTSIYKNQDIMYLDSDTFLFGELKSLAQKLENGHGLMHLNEGNLYHSKSKTLKKMWRQVKDQVFDSIKITEEHCMWNAGVIGLPGNKAGKIVERALNICDAMLKQNVTRRLIEQFAFSVALKESTYLLSVADQIGHYWANKEQWINIITDIFLKSFFTGMTVDQTIQSIQTIDLLKIPIHIKVPNTRKRFIKIIEKIFPDRNVQYVK